jgi:hypothetical protein
VVQTTAWAGRGQPEGKEGAAWERRRKRNRYKKKMSLNTNSQSKKEEKKRKKRRSQEQQMFQIVIAVEMNHPTFGDPRIAVRALFLGMSWRDLPPCAGV